jgi:tetratricopeptide (TPR) repeat protein
MADGETFCTQCGTPAANEAGRAETEQMPQEPQYYYSPNWQNQGVIPPPPPVWQEPAAVPPHTLPADRPKSRKKTLTIVLIAVGCALALCAGILVPVLIEKDRAEHYESARALMDDGDYEDAIAAFSSMGEYKDSPEMAVECQKTIDYDDALALMEAGKYEQSRDAFTALGNYHDAADQAKTCQNTIDYNAAAALMDAGEYQQALDGFAALGDFQDAANQAKECRNTMDYAAAAALMDAGEYADALAAFSALGAYSDASVQAEQCQKQIDYNAADEAYQSGFFFTACTEFESLSGFADASSRAEACLQAAPESGELYHNEDFAKKISIYIKNKGESIGLLVKFYSDNGSLASIAYIAPGKKVKVRLPRGQFTAYVAYGAQWFGDKEYFGSNAFYGMDEEPFELSSGYYYTYTITTPEPGDVSPGTMTYKDF